MARFAQALTGAALLVSLLAPAGCAARSSSTGAIYLKTVPRHTVSAMCLRFGKARKHVPVTRAHAVRAVENIPVLKRYGKRVTISEALVARVHAKQPSLAADHHPTWVLVFHQGHTFELYFVDAETGKLVSYMAAGEGCLQ